MSEPVSNSYKLGDMTTDQAEAWRAGWEAATNAWASAVLRDVYRPDWGKDAGKWCSGLHGDAPLNPELAALLDAAAIRAMEPPQAKTFHDATRAL